MCGEGGGAPVVKGLEDAEGVGEGQVEEGVAAQDHVVGPPHAVAH